MRKLIILSAVFICALEVHAQVVPIVSTHMTSPFCSDYTVPNNVQGWTGSGADATWVASGGNPGAFLKATDEPGASVIFNTSALYTGNWTSLMAGGCGSLCFDVKYIEGTPGKPMQPYVSITGNGFTAVFLTWDLVALDTVWHSYCAPLRHLTADSAMPYNDDGRWVMSVGQDTDWESLITNITRVSVRVEVDGYYQEKIGYDNICIHNTGNCTVHTPKPCCDTPGTNVALTRTQGGYNLNIDAGTTSVQEVTVSMMDYHVVYTNPACKAATMGIFGNLSSTTTQISTLHLDTAGNGTTNLNWIPGTSSRINNQNIGLTITNPLKLNLPCCDVYLLYCLKIRIKDTNCKVCEKIVCITDTIHAASVCVCNNWNSDLVHISNSVTPASTVAFNGTATLQGGIPYTFTPPGFDCGGNSCDPHFFWSIDGGPAIAGATLVHQFSSMPFVHNYTITVTPFCNTNHCKSQTFIIRAH